MDFRSFITEFLLTQKRWIFRQLTPEERTESLAQQHISAETEQMKSEFDRLLPGRAATQAEISQVIDGRLGIIREGFGKAIESHQANPEVKARLEGSRDRIVARLEQVKQRILDKFRELFAAAHALNEQHRAAYEQFLVQNGLLSRVSSTPGPTPSGRPEGQRESTPQSSPSTPSPTPRTTPETAPELTPQQIEERFLQLTRNWNTGPQAIHAEFSTAFFRHINNGSVQGRRFLQRAFRYPENLRILVRTLYSNYPSGTERHERAYQNYLSTLDLRLDASDISQAARTAIPDEARRAIDDIQHSEVREQWQREVEALPLTVESRATRELLFQIQSSLNAGTPLTRPQLLQLQNLVRYVETHLLDGEKLSWRAIRGFSPQQGFVVGLPQGYKNISLQGKTITVHNELVSDPGQSNKTVISYQGRAFDLDLPYLLYTVKQLGQTFSSSFTNQETVNFSSLAEELTNPAVLETRMNRERHQSLLRSLGMAHPERFEDFGMSLSLLLNEDVNARKTPQQWIELISRMQGDAANHQTEDQYKFLHLVRIYARTRVVRPENEVMKLSLFGEKLLASHEYRALLPAEAPTLTILQRRDELKRPPTSFNLRQEGKYNEEYRLLPNLLRESQQILDFTSEFSSVREPASRMVEILNSAEREWLTSHLTQASDGIPNFTNRFPGVPLDRSQIEKYHRFKNDFPFFREFLAFAERNPALTLDQLAHAVLTPYRTSDHRYF